MGQQIWDLVVAEAGNCPLLQPGHRWVLHGREIKLSPSARICGSGLCSIYPTVKAVAMGESAPSKQCATMKCSEKGCGAVFRLEEHRRDTAHMQDLGRTTRRLERGAKAASYMLQDAGPFLSRVPPDVAAPLMVSCESKRFPDGTLLLDAGVVGDHLYIVWDGEVEVVRSNPSDGTETLLAVLGKGECFGEMSLLTGQPTSAKIRARGETAIMALSRAKFEELLAKSPELNRVFSKLLADRLRVVNVTLENELARGILGKFSMMALTDLIQTLNGGHRTGTLVVHGKGIEGRLGFEGGKLIGAEWDSLKGEDAYFEIASWPQGDFCFEPDAFKATDQSRITRDTMSLLMETARRMDESRS